MTRSGRIAVTLSLSAWLAACGGGGGGDGAPAGNPSPSTTPTPSVAIDGMVTFDFVTASPSIGLDYQNTAARPARGVTVELVSGASVLATAVTDEGGRYSLGAPLNTDVRLRVPAILARSGPPGWDVRVVDNTANDALYALEGTTFNTGSTASTHDLHAASGWGGTSYTEPRAAAPFAILDVVYESMQLVLAAAPAAEFPPLVLHWSPDNVPSFASDGSPDLTTGEIGSSFFLPSLGIYLLGAEDIDTDEYDRHVIAHEWGHYFEHVFSRSDSIGGPHTRGDRLDMRVAFGEGFGNALAAMITGESIYRDVVGERQSRGFGFDVEGPHPLAGKNPHPGWFSEESIQELLYDVFDDRVDIVSGPTTSTDDIALGFEPIFTVLTGYQRETVALTSVFTFVNGLRAARPEVEPRLQELVIAQAMEAIVDDYGANQTNFGDPPSADLTAVYDSIEVNGPPVQVCSLDDFASHVTESVNKLGSRRYLTFSAAAGRHTFRAVATDVPAGEYADPDMVLHRAGPVIRSEGSPSATCEAGTTSSCEETFSRTLAAGPHVLEVYEWTNTSQNPEFPPIGRTCFAVTVTQP